LHPSQHLPSNTRKNRDARQTSPPASEVLLAAGLAAAGAVDSGRKTGVSGIEGVTAVLVAHREGEPGAFDRLVALVYPELRRIARQQLGRWRRGVSLDTGVLVNEAYLKLIDQRQVDWQDRNHFFAISARAMRQVLVDYARRRTSQKRGGFAPRVSVDDVDVAGKKQADDLLALDDLLDRLAKEDPRLLQVVECRFFAGYSEAETAELLRVSTRTVERDWLRAKAWLRQAMVRT
jgi:RNA polymerase sigma factor (TIGR02999 family)